MDRKSENHHKKIPDKRWEPYNQKLPLQSSTKSLNGNLAWRTVVSSDKKWFNDKTHPYLNVRPPNESFNVRPTPPPPPATKSFIVGPTPPPPAPPATKSFIGRPIPPPPLPPTKSFNVRPTPPPPPTKSFNVRPTPPPTPPLTECYDDRHPYSDLFYDRPDRLTLEVYNTSQEIDNTFNKQIILERFIILQGFPNPNKKLLEKDGFEILKEISKHLKILSNGEGPKFESKYIRDGAIILKCINKETAQWLYECIIKIDNYNGIKLIIGEPGTKNEIITKIPSYLNHKSIYNILEMLMIQNKDVNIKDWVYSHCWQENLDRMSIFILNEKSLKELKDKKFKLYLGCEQIDFQIISSSVYNNLFNDPDADGNL